MLEAPTTEAPEDAGLRADAKRNLTRILAAAREVFAEEGLEASVGEIAARAGVGVATVFRRFPTKEDLLAAVVEARLTELVDAAGAAAAHRDPGRGLRRFMEYAAAAQISDRGFCDAAGTHVYAHQRVGELVDALMRNVDELVARAQVAGHLRLDVTARDIAILLVGVAQVGLMLEPAAPGMWRRYLAIVIDGLSRDGARPLSPRPPTGEQFAAARCGAHRRKSSEARSAGAPPA